MVLVKPRTSPQRPGVGAAEAIVATEAEITADLNIYSFIFSFVRNSVE
jgi:hypothetical protein